MSKYTYTGLDEAERDAWLEAMKAQVRPKTARSGSPGTYAYDQSMAARDQEVKDRLEELERKVREHDAMLVIGQDGTPSQLVFPKGEPVEVDATHPARERVLSFVRSGRLKKQGPGRPPGKAEKPGA